VQVATACARLPFALALCGVMVRDGTPWRDLLDALRAADLAFVERRLPNYPYRDIFKCLGVSVAALRDEDPWGGRRLQELLGFRQGEAIPERRPRSEDPSPRPHA